MSDKAQNPSVEIFGSMNPSVLIIFLVYNNIPAAYEDVVDGLLEKEEVFKAMRNIANVIDSDDLFIMYTNWHGSGYLGYEPTQYKNIAYHGWFGSQPEIATGEDGDNLDYKENELEFTGYGEPIPDEENSYPDYELLAKGLLSKPYLLKNYFRKASSSPTWFARDPRTFEPNRKPNLA